MTQTKFSEQICRQMRARLDAYLDSELLADANRELREHIERCADCAQELEARRGITRQLQMAIQAIPVPADMRDRIRKNLERRTTSPILMAIAAALLLSLAWRGIRSQAGTLALLQIGVGDHVHCALSRQIVASAPELPRKFEGLLPAIQTPPGFTLLVAHECTYRGRQFVHAIYRTESGPLSLIITRKRAGESLQAAAIDAAFRASGVPVYTGAAQSHQVASFESRDHIVFTISDMSGPRNLAWMTAIAPSLHHFLQQMEG